MKVEKLFSDELIESLAEEWKQLIEVESAKEHASVLTLVDTWLTAFNSIQVEYSGLVSARQWLRGPSDLFSILGWLGASFNIRR